MDTKHLDIITTSLEALLQRGTSPKNVSRDSAAIEAFCGLVNKEPNCVPTAAKLIVSKMQSMQEWEALQALQLLEACMQNCGSQFHAEVGKFRFLNELIKLISPKYLGNLTPDAVCTEIIELLFLWTQEYPQESKIREAYEMLKKQRVVQSDPSISNRRHPPPSSFKPLPPPSQSSSRHHASSSILEDADQAKLLQKLLQSKKPEDLQAANKLIRSMVSEEEKKMEERCKVMLEMDSIKNNVSLLNEMLDNYSGTTSDWELIRELHTTCEGFQSSLVTRVQHLPTGDDDLLQLVISSNESLTDVLAKYNATLTALQAEETNTPLLDVNSAGPSPQHSLPNVSSHVNDLVDLLPQSPSHPSHASMPGTSHNIDLLNDLLNTSTPDSALLSFTTNENTSHTTDSALLNLTTNQEANSACLTNQNLSSNHRSGATPLTKDEDSNCPTNLLSSKPLDKLLSSSSLLNTAQSFQPISAGGSIANQRPQQIDLISNSPLNLKNPEAASNLGLGLCLNKQLSPCDSSRNSVHSFQQMSISQSQSSLSQNQSSISQNQSSMSRNPLTISEHRSISNDQTGLPRGAGFSNTPSGISPTAVNKLRALRDLDEIVGHSLSRLKQGEDGGRKDGDGSEMDGNSQERGNFSREGQLGEALEDVSRVTNGFGDGQGHFKSEECRVKTVRGDLGKGDNTMLQEDDEQLLLDDFTLEEAPASKQCDQEQESVEMKSQLTSTACDTKLSDVQISLSEIQPSGVESICALDNVNHMKVLIHVTRTRPKPNVAVFVIMTTSSHLSPVSGYLFQPVVPKGYKLKLQPPSSTSLPAFSPFLPSQAITQIMLIASPMPLTGNVISFKFVLSYEMEGENVSEMGEIAELPMIEE